RAVVLARPDPWQLTGAFHHGDGAGHAWLCGAESGELPAMTAAELQSAWLRLGNGGHASIWSWMQAEENGPAFAFDGGVVQIQREGVSLWELLTPVGGYDHEMSDTGGTNVIPAGTPCLSGRDTGWRQLHFDLSPWSGQRVRLRFLFGSDNVPSPFGLRGWLLDDFELQPGPREPTDAASPEFGGRSLLVRAPWPNPFRPSLRFELQVPRNAGHVVLEILDARGRLVTRLLDEEPGPGARVVVWRPQDLRRRLPAGVYGYRLVSRLGKEAGKLVLLQ
ncbi:MAG TPA: hypothetical protein VFE28_17060, partial [Candidatus Krumholzibacteria bacterium]|nr:hypothetical protein [Candidatus Krumholzibacteria bacterium]